MCPGDTERENCPEICQRSKNENRKHAKKHAHKLTFVTQPASTCPKLIIKTLEQGVKYVQS